MLNAYFKHLSESAATNTLAYEDVLAIEAECPAVSAVTPFFRVDNLSSWNAFEVISSSCEFCEKRSIVE
ncbi:MAG: hypothetical protein OXD49_14165 [Candidatus Poribacteria bacterium]|nr:hypothetical protein [Candidatus Poribacteria bacterium]